MKILRTLYGKYKQLIGNSQQKKKKKKDSVL
jgi:hypothetical protein